MNAAQINEYGGKDELKTVNDAPKPSAGKGQVLVAIQAAGVNPFDVKVREGYAQSMGKLKFPATLGGDFAGIVAEIGEGVAGVDIGDEVYGQAGALSGKGSFAEFTPIKADSLAPKPKSLDSVAAASLPLAGVSAYQALVDHAQLQKGQKVLIHGGAGGIGAIAVQLAKHLGAYVATTVSARDVDFVKALGADEAIDYKSQDFTQIVKDYDVVYDLVGGQVANKSYQVLKKGGVLVSMLEQSDQVMMQQYGVKAISQFTKVTRKQLEKLAELVDSGDIKAYVGKIFPLEQAADALDYLQTGKVRGKVVIKIS